MHNQRFLPLFDRLDSVLLLFGISQRTSQETQLCVTLKALLDDSIIAHRILYLQQHGRTFTNFYLFDYARVNGRSRDRS